jgi:radical SAM superfamily enzyme YgiQ (UPF0313 family)
MALYDTKYFLRKEQREEYNMKILLIAPKMSLRPMDSEFKRRTCAPLSLLTLSALTPPEHVVVIEDENVRPLTMRAADLVGITATVETVQRAYALAAQYRARGIPAIMGGIHPSACPEEALRYADAVCIGEAEPVWRQIVEDTRKGALQPMYRSDHPANLAESPFPDFNAVDASDYLFTNVLSATRGCPFLCDFCYNSAPYVHHLCRTRPVGQVVEAIRRMGTRQVLFIDDNLIGYLPWTHELVAALKPLGLTWHAAVSANIGYSPDLLDAMRDAGCRSLFIGFETINEDAIRQMRKYQNNVDRYDALIAAIHARGIMINASLVFGFDHDTPAVFENTLAWLVRNRVETMTAHILTPYPGTRLFDRLQAEGRIVDYDWSHYNTANAVFTPKGMSREELLQGYLWMYREFYSLKNICIRFPEQADEWMPYLLFNLGYRKFGKFTSLAARVAGMHFMGAWARRMSYGIA